MTLGLTELARRLFSLSDEYRQFGLTEEMARLAAVVELGNEIDELERDVAVARSVLCEEWRQS